MAFKDVREAILRALNPKPFRQAEAAGKRLADIKSRVKKRFGGEFELFRESYRAIEGKKQREQIEALKRIREPRRPGDQPVFGRGWGN